MNPSSIGRFSVAHVHFASVLKRRVEDDLPLEEWLDTLQWQRGLTVLARLASEKELAATFRLIAGNDQSRITYSLPVGNAKLGDGIEPLGEFLDAKINLGLGSQD